MTSTMEFDCKLAHQQDIKKVSGFNSASELYQRIVKTFQVKLEEILYCTLNTHDFEDTNALLGNYLSFGDLIVVHLCGKSEKVSLKKSGEYLGLTITDNGLGRAYVKKVTSDDMKVLIRPGLHIAAINSESMYGMRHYMVAKALQEIPYNSIFTLTIIEPKHLDNYRYIKQNKSTDELNRKHLKAEAVGNDIESHRRKFFGDFEKADNDSSKQFALAQHQEDLALSSLPIDRLLSKKSINLTESHDGVCYQRDKYRIIIDNIDRALEAFLGINDSSLAIQIYRMAQDNQDSLETFSTTLNQSELSAFQFDDDILTHLWNCATGRAS